MFDLHTSHWVFDIMSGKSFRQKSMKAIKIRHHGNPWDVTRSLKMFMTVAI